MTDREEALDPNTPPSRLIELMRHELDAVLQNPSLPLIAVERPDLWSAMPWQVFLQLAESPRCPASFAEWVLRAHGADELEPMAKASLLALNRAVPTALRREVFRRWAVPVELWRDLETPRMDFLSTEERAALVRCADGRGMTEATFERVAALGALGRELALRHPDCPAALLERQLTLDPDTFPEAVLKNPRLTPERLAGFLASPIWELQSAAVQNPAMTEAQLQAAARNPLLRRHLAKNPALPDALRRELAATPR